MTEPHRFLTELVKEQIWYAQQPLKFGPINLTTRMTVVKLAAGTLWVHSPITPIPALLAELSTLGTVQYVVAPNKSHHLFFLQFLAAHPAASGFIAEGLSDKRPDLASFPIITVQMPWQSDLEGFFIEGLPIINETVWFHTPSGTLILTDLLFCFSRKNGGISAFIATLLGVYGKPGMSRTMKLAVKNKQALRRSVEPLLDLPVQRIVLAHDDIIVDAARDKLIQAFAWL